jgi:hypothetical protein
MVRVRIIELEKANGEIYRFVYEKGPENEEKARRLALRWAGNPDLSFDFTDSYEIVDAICKESNRDLSNKLSAQD